MRINGQKLHRAGTRTVAALLCVLMLLSSTGVVPVISYAESEDAEHVGIAETTPEPTAVPTATPVPTEEPKPAETAEPAEEPDPTEEPEVTAEPTEEPDSTPEPTAEPTATPDPTEKPDSTAKPEPTAEPTPDTVLEAVFGKGAMALADFMELHPEAELEAASAEVSPRAKGPAGAVDPKMFTFVLTDIDGTSHGPYRSIAAMEEDGYTAEDWGGPVSDVWADGGKNEFPVIGGAENETDAERAAYTFDGLTVGRAHINGVGNVKLGEAGETGEYVYLSVLPGGGIKEACVVVVPVDNGLKLQVNYIQAEPASEETEEPAPNEQEAPASEKANTPATLESPALAYMRWLAAEAEKSPVLYKILYEGWDPYSSSMSLAEFYELMDLFERDILPIDDTSAGAVNGPAFAPSVSDGPSFDDPGEGDGDGGDSGETEYTGIIPRDMFNIIGLESSPVWSELPNDGETEKKLPMEDWPGFMRGNVYDENGQVKMSETLTDSNYFPRYDEFYYVYSITVDDIMAAVLGIIQRKDGGFVYYYLSREDQDNKVSTTRLPDGKKFTIRYAPNEYDITYQIMLNGQDVTEQYKDAVLSTGYSTRTNLGIYSFGLNVPNGYTAAVEVSYTEKNVETGKDEAKTSDLIQLNGINNGYPLGTDPIYTGMDKNAGTPDMTQGPGTLLQSASLGETGVKSDRTVTITLVKKAAPTFDMSGWLKSTNAGGNSGRGCVGTLNAKGGANWPNIIPTSGQWNWNQQDVYKNKQSMTPEKDADDNPTGTYSYELVFQTNTGDVFLLNQFQLNGTDLALPLTPMEVYDGANGGTNTNINQDPITVNGEIAGTTYTLTTLPDGAVVKVEYVRQFHWNSDKQSVYRITITGAYSPVTVTSGNLFMSRGGAREIAVYNISEGVYAIDSDTGEILPSAVEYYGPEQNNANVKWRSTYGPIVGVFEESETAKAIGDEAHYGANFRIKLYDGYDNPQLYLTDKSADAKVLLTAECLGQDADGYYYFYIPNQGGEKNPLLRITTTIVKYIVRYLPGMMSVPGVGNYDPDPDNPNNWDPAKYGLYGRDALNMPDYSGVLGIATNPNYDDNAGSFYDIATYNTISVSSTEPRDPGYYNEELGDHVVGYVFDHWEVVGTVGADITGADTVLTNDGKTMYKDGNGKWLLPSAVTDMEVKAGQQINLSDVAQYAIDVKGENATFPENVSVHVIRLQAVWRKLEDPVKYTVRLRWIDSKGIIQEDYIEEDFEVFWTDGSKDDNNEHYLEMQVHVIKEAKAFKDWIALHPTYDFWDEVNLAGDGEYDSETGTITEKELAALVEAFKKAFPDDDRIERDDFEDWIAETFYQDLNDGGFHRAISDYNFEVLPNGTIDIWFYESKGGLIFYNEVSLEPFVTDEEFYYTVSDITVGEEGTAKLNGEYYAYPYPLDRDPTADDTYTVTYVEGKIADITKNGESLGTYFKLKDGEGIRLYVPPGHYTLVEMGSKSGGRYKVDVSYEDQNGNTVPGDNVQFPSGAEGETKLWLAGSSEIYYEEGSRPDGVSQVVATVKFDAGVDQVVEVLTFTNKTSSLSIEKKVSGMTGGVVETFNFEVTLTLPDGDEPLIDGAGGHYYSVNIYSRNTETGEYEAVGTTTIVLTQDTSSGGNDWKGSIGLQGGQKAVIVAQVLDSEADINYKVTEDPSYSDTWYLLGEATRSGSIKVGERIEQLFENAYYPAGLVIEAEVIGPNASSELRFTYTITLKDVDGTGVSGSFEYILYNSDGTSTVGTATFSDGVCEVTLSPGQSIAFSDDRISGYMYEVEDKDDEDNRKSYVITYTDVDGKVPYSGVTKASFTYVELIDLVVKKTVAEALTSWRDRSFTFTLSSMSNAYGLPDTLADGVQVNNGTASFALKDGDTITLKIPYNTTYTLTENNTGFTTNISYAVGELTAVANSTNTLPVHTLSERTTAEFINSQELGALSVTKNVVNESASSGTGTNESFTITVTLTPPTGEKLEKTDCVITPDGIWSWSGGGAVNSSATVTFTLKDGETASISNLPVGTGYAVAENTPAKYQVSYSANASGSIRAGQAAAVTVTNKYIDLTPLTLTLSKTVTGNMGNRNELFEFQIELKDANGTALANSYRYYGFGVDVPADGEITSGGKVYLKSGQTIVIEGLPENTLYTIKELGAESYVTRINDVVYGDKTVSGNMGTENATVAYTNTLHSSIPTNATMEYGWLVPLALTACVGTGWLILRKRRRRYED